MKYKTKILIAGILFIIIAILFVVFGIKSTAIKIDNVTPAEQIVTHEYDLEKQLLAKAIFYVRHGFGEVNAFDLAKEVGIKLECKRQISENQFYFVVLGDYRCFIIVDECDIVQEVITIRNFPTIEQTRQWLEREENKTYITDTKTYITDTREYEFCDLWRNVGSSSVYLNYLFTLKDGVLLIRTKGKIEYAQYLFFTNEEWKEAYKEWEGFVILPIDKQ